MDEKSFEVTAGVKGLCVRKDFMRVFEKDKLDGEKSHSRKKKDINFKLGRRDKSHPNFRARETTSKQPAQSKLSETWSRRDDGNLEESVQSREE